MGPTLWIVRDPGPYSGMIDILWATESENLPLYVMGTTPERWRAENTTVYTDELQARADAETRMAKRASTR